MSAVDPGTGMTLEQQVEYWMEKYFKLQDEHADAVNALASIAVIVTTSSRARGAALDDLTPVAMCGLCGEPWTEEHADEGIEHYQLDDDEPVVVPQKDPE